MSAQITLSPLSRIGTRAGSQFAVALRTAWSGLVRAYRVALREEVSRRNIRALDDRMLADIGVSRAQAEFEANRKPWHTM